MTISCPYWGGTETVEGCSAPLCPMDEKSLKHGSWFVDEEVCRRATVPKWVHKQRRLVAKHAESGKSWTVPMLEKTSRICEGAEGINPDRDPKEAEASWLNQVQGSFGTKRVVSKEHMEKMRAARASRKEPFYKEFQI